MSDENEYLREGFDFKKLTIPQLRGILHKHDVSIPASVTRKADFQKLYEQEINANLKSLRRQYLQPNPSSENIHDASPRARSESPIRRSTRLRSQSPVKRPRSSGTQRTKRGPAAATAEDEPTSPTLPVDASPRRRKTNKKLVLDTDHDLSAPNDDDIRFTGPRTRSRSPVRLSKVDLPAPDTLRSPRRRKAPIQSDIKEEDEETTRRGRTPRRESSHSTAGNASTPSRKSLNSAHREQDNVFQSSRKRTSDHLGHKEERPHKSAARSSLGTGSPETKIEEEVDVMAEFTNFSETELNLPEVELAEIKTKLETPEKPRAPDQARRGFMPSLQALNVSNIFAQRLAPDPVSTPEVSDALPTDTENDADIEIELTPSAPAESKTKSKPAKSAKPRASKPTKVTKATTKDAEDTQVTSDEEETPVAAEEVKQHVRKEFVSALNAALVAFTTLIAVSLLIWWPSERSRQGYCDTTIVPPARQYPWFATFSFDDSHLQQVQCYIRQGVDYIAPSCMDCPEHAQCYANNQLECDEGFVERRTIGALLGFHAPSCERDIELERLLATLAERAVHVLRNRRARFECDGDVDSPEMTEDELYRELLALKAPQLSEQDFKELWDAVSAGLSNYPDVEMVFPRDCPPEKVDFVGEAETGDNSTLGCDQSPPLFVSHSLAHVNILCRLKLGAFVWLEERKKTIAYLFSLFVFFGVSSSFLAFRQRHKRRVSKTVDAAIAVMRSQQIKADNDRTGRTDRFVVAGPLFEAVPKPLRDEVDRILQKHKNVVYGQKEIKQGEIATIYEWTGL